MDIAVYSAYQTADYERGVLGVVMFSSRDDVELFIGRPCTVHQGNRDKIFTEISRCWVNEKTASVRRLDADGAECSGCAIVSLVRFGNSCWLQYAPSAGYRDSFGGIRYPTDNRAACCSSGRRLQAGGGGRGPLI